MKNILFSITSLLILTAITLWSCDVLEGPDDPAWPMDSTGAPIKKKIAIMGDSYSTYDGWSNKDVNGNDNGFYVYYPNERCQVDSVEKTWWYMLGQKPEFELEVSNSYSGSVISNTHYGGVDVTGTDLSFMNRVGMNPNGVDYNGNPDIILIFGGTNDCWAGVEMGDYVYENWTDEDLKCFRPAFSKLISSLLEFYPNAKVYNITNSGKGGIPGLTRSIAKSMKKVCEHYDIENIVLEDIDKVDAHPTYEGMQAICDQVYSVLRRTAVP